MFHVKHFYFYSQFILYKMKNFSFIVFYFLFSFFKLFHVKHYFDSVQENLLLQFLSDKGITLSDDKLEKLYEYANLVIQGNTQVNLISKNDISKFLSRHIADSLMPFIVLSQKQYLKSGMIWADMGAGGGCPVFPLSIVCPELQFFASEPRHKRVLFLEEAKKTLKLDNLTIVGKRFETSEITNCDIISCRALSRFEADYDRAQLGLKKNGLFITFKSKEMTKDLMNLSDIHFIDYHLPLETQEYSLVIKGIYG